MNDHEIPEPLNPIVSENIKKARESIALKPEHFEKKNGIKTLYEMSSHINLNKAEMNVQTTMKKIIVGMRTWHFNMTPKYSFQYFLQRAQSLGNHKMIQAYMSKVRAIHKGNASWQNGQGQKINQNINNNQNLQDNQNRKDFQMMEKFKKSMQIIDEIHPLLPQQDDQDLMQIFTKMQKHNKKNNNNYQQDSFEPDNQYIPQGFDQNYDDQ